MIIEQKKVNSEQNCQMTHIYWWEEYLNSNQMQKVTFIWTLYSHSNDHQSTLYHAVARSKACENGKLNGNNYIIIHVNDTGPNLVACLLGLWLKGLMTCPPSSGSGEVEGKWASRASWIHVLAPTTLHTKTCSSAHTSFLPKYTTLFT